MMRLLLTFTVLAASLGAADTGYIFGFIRTAPGAPPLAPERRQQLQAAHMAHIGAMASSGALVAAGPVAGSPNLRGIFVFKADADARKLADADPYVQAGELTVDLYRWRAPAGIGDRYFHEHNKNPNAPAKMIAVQLVVLRNAIEPGLARLAASGKLMAAGPLTRAGDLRAVAVVRAGSREAALALLEDAEAEVHNWMVADGVLPDPR
jgi:uncharacterized protein YciI